MSRSSRFSFAIVLAATSSASTVFAHGPVVARDPDAPPAVASDALRPTPSETPLAEHEKPRRGVDLGASSYMLAAAALDDFEQPVFLLRPMLELYASIGMGDVSVLLGGTVLGVELTASAERSGVSFPALLTIGVRDDRWLVATAGGLSLGSDNSYPDIDDAEESLPMPRAEIRAGYRIVNVMEITGFVGAERRLYWNRANETRMFVGVSFGTGADVDPRR